MSEFEGGSDDFASSSGSNDASDFSDDSGSDGGSDSDGNDDSDGGKFLPLTVSKETDNLIIGDDWDELERKAAKGDKATFCRYTHF